METRLIGGCYVDFVELDNGDLQIRLTDLGRGEVVDMAGKTDLGAFWDLAEDVFCTSPWRLIKPEAIAALTGCDVILTDEGELDEGSGLYVPSDSAKVWWHERYAIESLLDKLREDGFVTLLKAQAET